MRCDVKKKQEGNDENDGTDVTNKANHDENLAQDSCCLVYSLQRHIGLNNCKFNFVIVVQLLLVYLEPPQ